MAPSSISRRAHARLSYALAFIERMLARFAVDDKTTAKTAPMPRRESFKLDTAPITGACPGRR